MDDQTKTKQQLMDELKELRQRVSKLEVVEEALRKIEERLELALKGADLGLWDYNLKTGEAFINERRAEMVGYSVDELGTHLSSWWKLVHPDDLDRVTDAFNVHVQGRTPLYECEHRLRHKSGEYIWILARAKVVEWDEQRYPVRLVGTSLDITDRKRTEEALQSALDDLERRVEERTAELKGTNERLLLEMAERRQAEEQIKRAEEFLNTIVDNLPIPVFAKFAQDGQFILWNKASETLFGISKEQVIGKTDYDFFPKEQVDFFREKDRETFASGEIIDIWEEPILTKHLGTRMLHTRKVPVYDEERRPSYLLAISEDITERKHAEQAVRESEERFRQVAESASEWIWEVDENGLYRYCSDAVERILGYSSVELVGQKHFYDLFAPQVRQDLKEAAFATFGRKESFRNFVIANVRKDGEIVILESNGTPVLDKKGNLVGFRGADTDITERKQREEALRESEERLALALDSAEISFWDWDLTTGKAVWGGGRFFDLMGYSPDEVKPDVHTWKRLIHLEDWPHVSKALNDHLDGYLPIYGAEYRVQTKSGDWKWVLSQGKVVKRDKDGRSLRLVGTTQDISERKLAEEALRGSEKRYRSLFANMLEGYAHCKLLFEDDKPEDFVYLDVNDAFKRLTGLKNVVGHKATEVMPGIRESNSELFKIYGRVTSTGNPERFETYIDSLGIWLSVSVSSTERDHFVTVFDNITERKRAEEALRTSEAQLSNAVKLARLGHWEYDVAKDLFTFNDHFYQLYRTTAEQIGGYTLSSADYTRRFVHPDDIAVVGEEIRKSIEATDPDFSQQLEHRILYADGEIGYITVQIVIIKDELGRTIRTCGVNQDVTERKRAEESLRKSEERLELALQGADLGLWDLHIPTGQAVANQRAAEIAGYSLDEIEQNFGFWERLLHPDDRQRALEKVFNHLAGLTDHYEDEYRVRHKSGHWRWIFSRGKVTERDQDGKPLRMTGTYLDITDRKTFELQVAEANELRERIVSDSPMGIAVYKADGQCISANEALGRILGADRERLLTQNFRNLTSWKVSGLLSDAELVLSGGINNQSEVNFASTFGKSVWVNARMARLASGDEPHLLVVINDITERKKAEEEQDHLRAQLLQAQKMEATGTLAGGIAHDFNNLLTVVMGFSELLLAEKEQGHPEYADLQKIFHAAKNGADLVQRLLMFSRKAEPKPVPMDLNKQIVQVEKLLRRTIPRMVDIGLELSPDLPRINADPSQVEQVLMNLAVNARDAMPDKGKLTVRTDIVTLDEEYCRLHIEANPGEYVLLEVSDTGHGMDKETVEHIFEPFFTTKEMGRGTGLGLAMVYGIVKQHNGHITVHSEVGQGTTFQVYLPAIPGEAETGVEAPEEVPAFGTETVLLVDDEEFVRELGGRILTKHGYTVLQAENGKKSLDLFKKEHSRISLVILDLIMPEMGGTECLKELLKIDPNVKVLVASGYSADASVKETIQMGAKSFVAKPFRSNDLLGDVRRVLDRS